MGDHYAFGVDEHGAPVLLTTSIASPDPRAEQQRAAVEQSSLTRRRDAVVDAARTLEDLTPTGVEAFVRQRWRGTKVLDQADVDAFSVDAITQRTHDVVDALAGRVHRGVFGMGSKHARVELPRGWVRRALRAMGDDEVAQVSQRLVDRGWTGEQVAKALRTYRREIQRAS
jgi:hypothetical protein